MTEKLIQGDRFPRIELDLHGRLDDYASRPDTRAVSGAAVLPRQVVTVLQAAVSQLSEEP